MGLLEFVRGDANNDMALNLADAIYGLNWLFQNGPEPACQDAADSNDDGMIDVSDTIYLISFYFVDGPEPPPPFRNPGTDPTSDNVDCQASAWDP